MYSPVIGPENVGAVLRRRGFEIAARGNDQDILLPFHCEPPLSGEQINRFRELFSKSTFRKLVRKVTSEPDSGTASLEELIAISGRRTDEYIRFLKDLGVVDCSNAKVTLTRSINDIGKTLEWYVADVCKRDFEGSAQWSVKLSDFRYGDCDVLAWLPPTLAYIETKSSHPSQVSDSAIRHFLQRGLDLAPDLAILLIDTDNNLTALLDRTFELMLPTVKLAKGIKDPEWRHDEKPFIAPQSKYPGIHFGYQRFYITNTKPSIRAQLSRCLRHYHSEVKG